MDPRWDLRINDYDIKSTFLPFFIIKRFCIIVYLEYINNVYVKPVDFIWLNTSCSPITFILKINKYTIIINKNTNILYEKLFNITFPDENVR